MLNSLKTIKYNSLETIRGQRFSCPAVLFLSRTSSALVTHGMYSLNFQIAGTALIGFGVRLLIFVPRIRPHPLIKQKISSFSCFQTSFFPHTESWCLRKKRASSSNFNSLVDLKAPLPSINEQTNVECLVNLGGQDVISKVFMTFCKEDFLC